MTQRYDPLEGYRPGPSDPTARDQTPEEIQRGIIDTVRGMAARDRNPNALNPPVPAVRPGNGWVDPLPRQRSAYQDQLVDGIAEKFEPGPKG